MRVLMVDHTGFEPVTPCMSSKCSNRAELMIHRISSPLEGPVVDRGRATEGSPASGTSRIFHLIFHFDPKSHMVPETGIEPVTLSLEGSCSIQLSYSGREVCCVCLFICITLYLCSRTVGIIWKIGGKRGEFWQNRQNHIVWVRPVTMTGKLYQGCLPSLKIQFSHSGRLDGVWGKVHEKHLQEVAHCYRSSYWVHNLV